MWLIDIFNSHSLIAELLAYQSNPMGKGGIGKSNCELGLQAVLKITFTLELTAKQHAQTHNFIKALKGLYILPNPQTKHGDLFHKYLSALCEKENYVVMGDFGWGYQRICCAVESFSSTYK